MSILKSVETTIANLVEGAFGRVFRAEVGPLELARKLAREMDAHRTVSISRVYAPSEYEIWLSPQDRARYEGVEEDVIEELCAYLLEHARREELILASQLHVVFHTDERLSLGEFGIQARSVGAAGHSGHSEDVSHPQPADLPSSEEHGQTMIYSTSARVRGLVEEAHTRGGARPLLAVNGRRLLVAPTGGVIGRSRSCEIVLDDVGVSRRHAEIRPSATGWTVEDLGSTNGISVNGHAVRGAQPLRSGDRVELGSTEIIFEVA